jgi:hypothetical protein
MRPAHGHTTKAQLTPELLESRLNLSTMAGLSAPQAASIVGQTRIMGVQFTGISSGISLGNGFGAAIPLSTTVTSIPVNSYTAISNCGLEVQAGQTQPDIGFVKTSGSYVEYTVTGATAGAYSISLGLASFTGAQVDVQVNGVDNGQVTAPATKSWTTYKTGTLNIQLPAGTNVIRLASLNGTQYNINSVVLTNLTTTQTASTVTAVGGNTAVDVTGYSGIWKSQLEYQGGKPDIGYVSMNGAYVEYTINVATAGTYTLTTGIADVAASTIGVTGNGSMLATIAQGKTGSWQDFVDNTQTVTLGSGVQTLRFTALNSSEYNIGSIQLVRQTAPVDPPPSPAGLPISVTQRWMTSFNEIDIVGTSDNDSIYVSESGGTLTITGNGKSQQVAANGELAIWGGDGNDTITVDSSVLLAARIYGGLGKNVLSDATRGQATIVSLGGAGDTLTGNALNTSFWADTSDTVNAASTEQSLGGVHMVSGFYGGVSLQLNGPNLADPVSSGAGSTRLSSSSFFGLAPAQEDINQGQVGDCYLLTSLQSLARLQPGSLRQMGVDLGDGTYAIQFKRNGVTQYVRVDGDLPTASWGGLLYAHPGATGNQWAPIFEKAYAIFRSGQNSYASLNLGFMTAVYNDLGVAATTITLGTDQNAFYTMAASKLSSGKAVDIGSNAIISNGAPLIANHAYSITNIWRDGGGTVWVTLRNPWGIDGVSSDSNPADGLVTMSYSMLHGAALFGTTVS